VHQVQGQVRSQEQLANYGDAVLQAPHRIFVIEEIMENAVQVENPYGIEAMWSQGDAVARGTLIILLVMSAVSWYIIFTKLWDQRRLKQGAKVVEKQFWSSGSLKEAVDRLPKDNDFRAVAEDGLRASAHHEGRLTDRIDLHEWVTMSLQRSVDSVNSKLLLNGNRAKNNN
jgi:biopolymer transport protein ExbB